MKDTLKQSQLSARDILANGDFLDIKEVLKTSYPSAGCSVSLDEKFRLGINQGVAVSCQPKTLGLYGAEIENGWLMRGEYLGENKIWLVYVAKYFKGEHLVAESLPLGGGLISHDAKFTLA